MPATSARTAARRSLPATATTRKPASSGKPVRRGKVTDAIALLKDDHKRVSAMFAQFDRMKSDGPRKEALVAKICDELTVHATVEEEILYPAAREVLRDADLMDEADVEHAGAKSLIGELESMKPGDDHYDAKVTVLGEYIKHHVKEEHEEMFPKLRKSKLDMAVLGERIALRKHELAKARANAQDAIMTRFIPMV